MVHQFTPLHATPAILSLGCLTSDLSSCYRGLLLWPFRKYINKWENSLFLCFSLSLPFPCPVSSFSQPFKLDDKFKKQKTKSEFTLAFLFHRFQPTIVKALSHLLLISPSNSSLHALILAGYLLSILQDYISLSLKIF